MKNTPESNKDMESSESVFDTSKAVQAPKTSERESELDVLNQQGLLAAQTRGQNAEAADKEKLTELKESYAAMVMFFLWFWFGALCLLMLTYLSYQIALGKEIPKEIIIAAFTSTAVVVGLVGYILKGLFGNKN